MVTPYSNFEAQFANINNYQAFYNPAAYQTPQGLPTPYPFMESFYSPISTKSESSDPSPTSEEKKKDPMYREKRDRNNEAAKKSRLTRKMKEADNMRRIEMQANEIVQLNNVVKQLQDRLSEQQHVCCKCGSSLHPSAPSEFQPLCDSQNLPPQHNLRHPFASLTNNNQLQHP